MNFAAVPTEISFSIYLIVHGVSVGTAASPGITNESDWTVKRFNAPERGDENYIHLDLNWIRTQNLKFQLWYKLVLDKSCKVDMRNVVFFTSIGSKPKRAQVISALLSF